MNELWKDYLKYLINRYNLDSYLNKYKRIFEILHNKDFEYFLDRDENRYCDGIELRDDYKIPIKYWDLHDKFMNKKCSLFEMLLALSIRMDNEVIGDPAEEHPETLFIEMIDNLDLLRTKSNYEIDYKINKWIYRDFKKNGKGSPFPVKYDDRDQRYLEICDQAMSYINENFV